MTEEVTVTATPEPALAPRSPQPSSALSSADPAAGLGPPEPELVLVLEPAVQPAAIRPAATITPYLVTRLMPFVLTAV